jgi:hypothetical protein
MATSANPRLGNIMDTSFDHKFSNKRNDTTNDPDNSYVLDKNTFSNAPMSRRIVDDANLTVGDKLVNRHKNLTFDNKTELSFYIYCPPKYNNINSVTETDDDIFTDSGCENQNSEIIGTLQQHSYDSFQSKLGGLQNQVHSQSHRINCQDEIKTEQIKTEQGVNLNLETDTCSVNVPDTNFKLLQPPPKS